MNDFFNFLFQSSNNCEDDIGGFSSSDSDDCGEENKPCGSKYVYVQFFLLNQLLNNIVMSAQVVII